MDGRFCGMATWKQKITKDNKKKIIQFLLKWPIDMTWSRILLRVEGLKLIFSNQFFGGLKNFWVMNLSYLIIISHFLTPKKISGPILSFLDFWKTIEKRAPRYIANTKLLTTKSFWVTYNVEIVTFVFFLASTDTESTIKNMKVNIFKL